MRILIPASGVTAVVDETAAFGVRDLETGGFLLVPRSSSADGGSPVAVIALAGDTGIVRDRRLFQISERALDRIFAFADDHDLWIPAQFHSHKVDAFLSRADQRHGLCVEEFISAVIPTYASPPRDLARWGMVAVCVRRVARHRAGTCHRRDRRGGPVRRGWCPWRLTIRARCCWRNTQPEHRSPRSNAGLRPARSWCPRIPRFRSAR